MDDFRARIGNGAILVAAATVAVVAIFGGAQDPWHLWVKDFQTLIAAILAIAAAYLTIRETRRADANQERRHRDLRSLELRKDRMTVERCASKADAYRSVADYFGRTVILALSPASGQYDIVELSQPWDEIRDTLQFPGMDVAEGRPLFGPLMEHRYAAILHFRRIAVFEGDAAMEGDEASLMKLFRAMTTLREHIRRFANDLEALRDEYRAGSE